MSNSSISSTVLAWLQKETSLYSELLVISPIRDLSIEYWQGKPLLCLAHHFFPDAIPNLIEQLQQQSSSTLTTTAYQLFQDRLGVVPFSSTIQEEDKWVDYLSNIQSTINDKREHQPTDDTTLRELHIGNDNNNTLVPSVQQQQQEFEKCVVNLLLPLNKLFHQLVELSIREEEGLSISTRSPSPRITTTVEEVMMVDSQLPIKSRLTTTTITTTTTAMDDTASLSSSTTSFMTLEEIESTLSQLESRDLLEFHTLIDTLPSALLGHPDLAVRISAIDATHAALHLQLHKGDMLRTTIQFTNTAAYIRNELEFIQAKMLKTTTTDVGIQDLESRAKTAGQSIENLGVRFKELFINDPITSQEYNFLSDKYRLICCWVDDVRVWFVEAERIRTWIEERIRILEENPNMNALEEVELDYEVIQIDDLNRKQEDLEKEVEAFDKEDMTRLRAHVKALTGTERGNKDLSPADTTTIEITFTTLMTLDRLMHLLRRHSYELQMLTLRMYWEQEYHTSVTWVRATGEEVRLFVQQRARWRLPPLVVVSNDESDENKKTEEKNAIIETLIDFEKKSAAFDQGQFTTTVNMYQDLDDACNIELPSHLESRQVAIEEAFEELTNRIAFARQVVEQYLVVTDFLDRADKLKNEGDVLRQEITVAAENHSSHSGTNDFSEKVSLFQENAVRLVTGVASRVPYPEATHPTDQQGNDDANEVIRMVVGARKSALVLFGEALDHSLSSYRRALQLQKRAKQLQDEISRLLGWVDERMRSIKKSKVDVFVAKCALDETDLARLKKERDGQVAKMNGIKENEIKRLQENIQALQLSSSQPPTNPNTVGLVTALQEGMVGLGDQLVVLDEALQVHSLCLDILGKRISWEMQHAKTSLWISNMTFQVWEFVSRKAQWRPDIESLDRALVQQEFDVMQNKMEEFHVDQLKHADQTFTDLVNGFSAIIISSSFDDDQPQDNITPEHVQRRQDTLDRSFHNLYDLIEFAKQVLSQHSALTGFSSQVSVLRNKGHGLIQYIQSAMDGIMRLSNMDERRQGFVAAVKEFSQDVVQLWMQSGSQLPYPQCPEDARATRPTTSDDEISTEVATVIFKTYTELQDLVKRMSELLQRLDISIVYRVRLEQWCTEADNFTSELKALSNEVESVYTFGLNTGSVVDSATTDISAGTYLAKAESFSNQVAKLKTEKYESLCAHLDDLKYTLEDDEAASVSVDASVTQDSLTTLDASWQGLTHSIELFSSQATVCNHRTTWESLWVKQLAHEKDVQYQVLEWINEKNVWLSSSSGDSAILDSLVSRMQDYDKTINAHLDTDFPLLTAAFQDMVVSYRSLQKVSENNMIDYATSLESKQDDLEKRSMKLKDLVSTQLSEIQFLKARHNWELLVDRELKACAEKALETESFIRQSARWSPTCEDSVNAQSIHELAVAQVDALSSSLKDLAQLQADTASNSLLQTEIIFRRKSALEYTVDRVQEHVQFLDQVLEQRQAIVSSLAKVSELDALAESIKTRFLSSDTATVDGQEQAELDKYNARVSELVKSMGQVMTYPVRHYRDHDAQCREEDISHNAVMIEMMNARRSRLDELGSTLESILKSKERLSRCKAAEETYMSEAQVVKEWIDAKFIQVEEIQPSSSVEDLRQAVTAIGAIQSAALTYTSSVQGLKESANQCITMIKQQGEDDNDGILGGIQSSQTSINASWEDLNNKILLAKTRLSTTLRHEEYNKCVESFHVQCKDLQTGVVGMDLSNVTEEVTNQWQNDIQMLEITYIEQIRSRLSEEKSKSESDGVSQETLEKMGDMLTVVLKDFEAFKTLVAERTTEANHHRFKNEYFAGADALDACIAETRAALDNLKSGSGRVIRGESVEKDKETVKQVTETYQAICEVFENQHNEKYDEQRSFYRFLQLNKVADLSLVDKRQAELEQRWKKLKLDVANDKHLVEGVSQWFDLHGKLNEMQSEALSSIFQRLDQMVLDDDNMPSFLDQDSSLLKLIESRLSACLDIATSLVDDGNMACFQTRYDELQKDLVKSENLLAEKKGVAQKHVDFISCQILIKDVQESAEQAVDTVKQRLDSLVIDNDCCESKYLEQLYRNSSTDAATTEAQQKKLVGQSTSVIEPLVSSLQSKYADDERIGSMKTDVSGSLESLNDAIQKEQDVNDMMRRVLGHAKSAENISTWIENCNLATSQVLGDHLDEGEAALEIESLSQKLVDFENVMDSFKDLSKNLLQMEHSNDNPILNKLIDIVNKNSRSIEENWKSTQDQLKSAEATVQKTARGVAIARKIKNIMAMVGETREYATSVKLFDNDDVCSVRTQDKSDGASTPDIDEDHAASPSSTENIGDTHTTAVNSDEDDDKTEIGGSGEDKKLGEEITKNDDVDELETAIDEIQDEQQPILSTLRQSEVEDIQRSLQTLESDIKPQIELELSELSTMISEFEDINNTFIRQHQEVQESVASMFQLLSSKYVELDKAMAIGKYLTIADDIEILQSSLEEAVFKSAPHHATLIGSSFSRTDLQAKLIELDARFKYYEKKIVQNLASAKKQALVVIAKKDTESELVEAHLQEMEEKWELIKKQFKTRKIELSRTIDTSVDPKEQHARLRKSSLPTRKASSLLKDRADLSLARQHLSPTDSSTTSSSTSSSTKSSTNTSRLNPGRSTSRYLTPHLQHQPSKSATHLKSKTGRLTTIVKPPLNSYVADPDNDLDIEIGRIVNETPYRVKVKMVPGEVGRYWFGNLNPKLAYCRVLKSKMVMVRVGGGWTELSQFLRDHALLEGDFIPRNRRNTNNMAKMIPEEEEPKSPTIQEGFIETRRAFGRGEQLRQRSVSPNTQPQQQRSSTTTNSSSSRSNTTTGYPTGSPSHSVSTNTTSGYKEGDKFIAVDQHGNQLEVKMRKVSNDMHGIGRNMSTTTANTSSNDYTRRRIARRKEKGNNNTNNINTSPPTVRKTSSSISLTKATASSNDTSPTVKAIPDNNTTTTSTVEKPLNNNNNT